MNWKSQRFFKSTTSGCPRCERKHKENVHVLVLDCCLVVVLVVGFLGVQGQGPGVHPILFPLHYTNSMCEIVNSSSISSLTSSIVYSAFPPRSRQDLEGPISSFVKPKTRMDADPNRTMIGTGDWGGDGVGIGLCRTQNTEGPPKCTEISIEICPLTRSFNRRIPNDVDG